MSYIRTKDGKIHMSYSDYQSFDKLWVCKKLYTLGDFYYVRRSRIVAQANTIEELCDCFVVIDKEKVFPNQVYDKRHLYTLKTRENTRFIIYGAIWTNKGLIYVAKMNENGELRLI